MSTPTNPKWIWLKALSKIFLISLKGIPLRSDNMVLLVSAHSTVALEGKFQFWKPVKTGFYNSGKNTLTVIKLVKSITHHFKLQASLKNI